MKERKLRRKKKSRLPLLIAATAIVLIIIIGIALYLQTSKPKEYKDPNEYFEVTGVTALVDSTKSDNQTIFIRILIFNLTAVGGDAHNVYIKPPGSIELEDYPYNSTVWKGKPWEVSIQYPFDNPLMWDRDSPAEPFQIEVGIVSDETGSEGKITLYLTDDHIIKP